MDSSIDGVRCKPPVRSDGLLGYSVDFAIVAMPRRGVRDLSRAGAFGSRHLPCALQRVLHARPKIKPLTAGSARHVRGCAGVCSKAANCAFIPSKRASAIAVKAAGRRRGNGRDGRHNRDIERRSSVKRSGLIRAGGIETASRAANHQSRSRMTTTRG
jgi:hypothetical protein